MLFFPWFSSLFCGPVYFLWVWAHSCAFFFMRFTAFQSSAGNMQHVLLFFSGTGMHFFLHEMNQWNNCSNVWHILDSQGRPGREWRRNRVYISENDGIPRCVPRRIMSAIRAPLWRTHEDPALFWAERRAGDLLWIWNGGSRGRNEQKYHRQGQVSPVMVQHSQRTPACLIPPALPTIIPMRLHEEWQLLPLEEYEDLFFLGLSF